MNRKLAKYLKKEAADFNKKLEERLNEIDKYTIENEKIFSDKDLIQKAIEKLDAKIDENNRILEEIRNCKYSHELSDDSFYCYLIAELHHMAETPILSGLPISRFNSCQYERCPLKVK